MPASDDEDEDKDKDKDKSHVSREDSGWVLTDLQLLQPVLTLGLLVLARLCFG